MVAKAVNYVGAGTVEHVEDVCDDQDDAGPEELADTEQDAAADVDGHTDRREQVRVHARGREPANHRVDDPHCTPAYTRSEHRKSLESMN